MAKKQGRRLTTNNQQGTLGGDENVLYINYGGEYMPAHICQNSSHCTLTRVNFTMHKLYFNKPDQKKQFLCDSVLSLLCIFPAS